MSTDQPVIYTAWCDYFGTGEGRTMVALVARARDEAHMRLLVHEHLGEFWSVYAEIAPGVVRNQVTEALWAQGVFSFLERGATDAGAVLAKCELHANFG